MGHRTAVVILIAVLVCVVKADPPTAEILPSGPTGSTVPSRPRLELPDDLKKIRARFGSPLTGSILGESTEEEVREAFEKARATADERPVHSYPLPPVPMAKRRTVANLLEISWKVERQAYQLEQRGEYQFADELREVTKRIRERVRAKASRSRPLPSQKSY